MAKQKFSLINSLVNEDEIVADNSLPRLSEFADSLKHSPSGTMRVVLRMTISDLKNLYLKRGGGIEFVNNLSDSLITKIATAPGTVQKIEPSDPEIIVLRPGYTFSDLIVPANKSLDAVVLLNIPTGIIDDLKKSTSSVEDAKAALTKMMLHKYYVMTLSYSRARPHIKPITKFWGNIEQLASVADPNMVIAYPDRDILASLKDDWAKNKNAEIKSQQAKAQVKDIVGAKPAEAPPPAQKASPEDEAAQERAELERVYNVLVKYNKELGRGATLPQVMKKVKDALG